jgi:hypothetical protein
MNAFEKLRQWIVFGLFLLAGGEARIVGAFQVRTKAKAKKKKEKKAAKKKGSAFFTWARNLKVLAAKKKAKKIKAHKKAKKNKKTKAAAKKLKVVKKPQAVKKASPGKKLPAVGPDGKKMTQYMAKKLREQGKLGAAPAAARGRAVPPKSGKPETGEAEGTRTNAAAAAVVKPGSEPQRAVTRTPRKLRSDAHEDHSFRAAMDDHDAEPEAADEV